MSVFPQKAKIGWFCLLLSIFTLAVYHAPFFQHLFRLTEPGTTGVFQVVSAALLLLVLNYVFFYLLVFLFRKAGKFLVAVILFGNAAMLYFVKAYGIILSDDMMLNSVSSNMDESSGFFCAPLWISLFLLGVLPALYPLLRKVEYGSWKQFFTKMGVGLTLLAAIVCVNVKNGPWFKRNSEELVSLTAPWAYLVNSVRSLEEQKRMDREETALPDITFSDSKDLFVLYLGESIRQDHLALYGYPKPTNPYTSEDGFTVLKATSANTFTIACVKVILEPFQSETYYEPLPNYLGRNGAHVVWRTSNWGQPPLHDVDYITIKELRERFPDQRSGFDEDLLSGLKEDILAIPEDKQFVVIHAYTNHGPDYYTDYPPQFEVFTPITKNVCLSRANPEELSNTYDNSLVYTDYMVHRVLETLKEFTDRRVCLLYMSDHGESLGEDGVFMHAMPLHLAPESQTIIPFMVWTSDPNLHVKPLEEVDEHYVFHTVLDFLGADTPVFDKNLSIFE